MDLKDSRWVLVTWCDDVRQEIGNKLSYMGVFTSGLVVQSLPTVIHRIAAQITISTPISNPFKKMVIRLVRNDYPEPVAEISLSEQDLPGMVERFSEHKLDTSKCMALSFTVMIGPTELSRETEWFKVFVDTETETLESFKLRVSVA